MIFLIIAGIYRVLSGWWWSFKGWKPFQPTHGPKENPSFWVGVLRILGLWTFTRLRAGLPAQPACPPRHWLDRVGRIPWSPFLPLGIFFGALFLSLLTTSAWLSEDYKPKSTDLGRRLMRLGAVGGTAFREDRMKAVVNKGRELAKTGTEQQQKDWRENRWSGDKWWSGEVWYASNPTEHDLVHGGVRTWLAPYVPVYGAFTLNFVLISLISIIYMLQPFKLFRFSPAVGIVFLCNMLVWANAVMKSFFPFPGDYWLLFLFVLVLVMGRAYKMRFPNLQYREPVLLQTIYTQRAEQEAHEVMATGHAADTPLPPTPPPGLTAALPEPPAAPLPAVTSGGTGEYRPIAQHEVRRYAMPGEIPAKGGKPPLAFVCVSGGGSRAAAWTMKTLLEIEDAFRDPGSLSQNGDTKTKLNTPVSFPYRVRLVTGASGGMIAGAYYVASLAEPGTAGEIRRNAELTSSQLFDGVCQDFLTPVVHTFVTRDLPSWLLPFHLGRDRGCSMEMEWQTTMHGQLDQTFADLLQGERAGWRPSLIFSPMLVEDARQLFISNLDLAHVVRNMARILGEPDNLNTLNPQDANGDRLLSREGIEFFKLFPNSTKEFRVATAARMSASFPYVLPAVALPTNPPRRVVDAGYYDNYGVGIAASWLFDEFNLQWVREHTSGVVIIQIRDGASGEERRREVVSDGFPSDPAAGLHGVTSPPTGLYNSRFTGNEFRNDNLIHLLNRFFRSRGFPKDFLTTVSFELAMGDDIALNFALTEGERATIEAAVDTNGFRNQLVALLDWWHDRLNTEPLLPPPPPPSTPVHTHIPPSNGPTGQVIAPHTAEPSLRDGEENKP
jgi:hypothetical protein